VAGVIKRGEHHAGAVCVEGRPTRGAREGRGRIRKRTFVEGQGYVDRKKEAVKRASVGKEDDHDETIR